MAQTEAVPSFFNIVQDESPSSMLNRDRERAWFGPISGQNYQ